MKIEFKTILSGIDGIKALYIDGKKIVVHDCVVAIFGNPIPNEYILIFANGEGVPHIHSIISKKSRTMGGWIKIIRDGINGRRKSIL